MQAEHVSGLESAEIVCGLKGSCSYEPILSF